MGKGFPVDSIPPSDVHTVLIFATGSGGWAGLGVTLALEGPGHPTAMAAAGRMKHCGTHGRMKHCLHKLDPTCRSPPPSPLQASPPSRP